MSDLFDLHVSFLSSSTNPGLQQQQQQLSCYPPYPRQQVITKPRLPPSPHTTPTPHINKNLAIKATCVLSELPLFGSQIALITF